MRRFMLLFRVSLTATAMIAQNKPAEAASPCANIPHGDHPKHLLSNGKLDVLVSSARCKEWILSVLTLRLVGSRRGAHRSMDISFFGEWFTDYDPLKNDSITGPVEEFRIDGGPMVRSGPADRMSVPPGAIGYADAKPGDLFLKPGVGVLRKVDDKPYQFGFLYPIVDTGKWTTKIKSHSILFRQVLRGPQGYAYIYEKELILDKNDSVMTLEHRLRNTGKKTIDTKVYDHDFSCWMVNQSDPVWQFTSTSNRSRLIP